jgi:hypothetical protein
MPASAALLKEFPPPLRLIQTVGAVRTPAERDRFRTILRQQDELARLIEQAKQDRTDLEEASAWLTEHFDQPAPEDVETDWLVQALNDTRAKEKEFEAALMPLIDSVNELLAPAGSLPAAVEQLMIEWRAILEGWVIHYCRLREMLARQLTERRAASAEILRARPPKGEIDYAELSREHIARYPKIRARLAE